MGGQGAAASRYLRVWRVCRRRLRTHKVASPPDLEVAPRRARRDPTSAESGSKLIREPTFGPPTIGLTAFDPIPSSSNHIFPILAKPRLSSAHTGRCRAAFEQRWSASANREALVTRRRRIWASVRLPEHVLNYHSAAFGQSRQYRRGQSPARSEKHVWRNSQVGLSSLAQSPPPAPPARQGIWAGWGGVGLYEFVERWWSIGLVGVAVDVVSLFEALAGRCKVVAGANIHNEFCMLRDMKAWLGRRHMWEGRQVNAQKAVGRPGPMPCQARRSQRRTMAGPCPGQKEMASHGGHLRCARHTKNTECTDTDRPILVVRHP